ncbi:hypothetical protein QCE88_14185 [Caballeronia sp. LZ035]|nr:hypothetical protein [Caballeronia sp. LZ035]MDR5758099.1 hypothetical protein [Caballeronia sp. LZ035]
MTQGLLCFRFSARVFKKGAQIAQRLSKARSNLQRMTKCRFGIVEHSLFGQHRAQTIERFRPIGTQHDCATQLLERIGAITESRKQSSEIEAVLRRVRIEFDCAVKRCLRFFELIQLLVQPREIEMRDGEIGIDVQCATLRAHRFLIALLCSQRQPEIGLARRALSDRKRNLNERFRFGGIAIQQMKHSQKMIGFAMKRHFAQDASAADCGLYAVTRAKAFQCRFERL